MCKNIYNKTNLAIKLIEANSLLANKDIEQLNIIKCDINHKNQRPERQTRHNSLNDYHNKVKQTKTQLKTSRFLSQSNKIPCMKAQQ